MKGANPPSDSADTNPGSAFPEPVHIGKSQTHNDSREGIFCVVKLRPYQQHLLRKVETALSADTGARVMMQLPTGGGKTIIAGSLLADWLTGGRKAVWLTHRRELAHQTRNMLTDDHIPAIADVNWTPGTDAPAMSHGVVILMAQTVGRRTAVREIWNRYNGDDLLVIDEAHHAAAEGWERAMRQWPGCILGLTATPWRLSEKEGFDHLFGALFCGPQVDELQTDDWLCDALTLMPSAERRIVGGEVDRTGEFTELGIELANQDRPNVMTAGALDFWQKHAVDRPTIVYAVSVAHAQNLTQLFNNAGIRAAVILGDSRREDRDEAINGFRDGMIKVLVNVIVATEGFDLPDASCIVIARPTMSLALYLQMVGRGLRPKDGHVSDSGPRRQFSDPRIGRGRPGMVVEPSRKTDGGRGSECLVPTLPKASPMPPAIIVVDAATPSVKTVAAAANGAHGNAGNLRDTAATPISWYATCATLMLISKRICPLRNN